MTHLLLHVLAGALIAGTPVEPQHAAALVVAAAVGKEVYDYRRGGRFDTRDVLATVGGGMPILVLRWEF